MRSASSASSESTDSGSSNMRYRCIPVYGER